jgi:hypothetical protein
MRQPIQEENKALVQEAFDTLFNNRDHAAAESRAGVEHQPQWPI